MSFAPMQTPQRPLPGAYFNTPAAPRFGTGAVPPQPIFRPQSFVNRPPAGESSNPTPAAPQPPQSRQQPQTQSLPPIARAARTISDVLQREASFPEIDSYVRRKGDRKTRRTKLTKPQKVFRPTMTFPTRRQKLLGRHFKEQRCTISRTESSSNTTAPSSIR